MNAGRAAHARWILLHQSDRGVSARERAASDHHARDPNVGGPLYYSLAIVIEAVMGEIEADVAQGGERRGTVGKAAWINRHWERLCYLPAMNCSARIRRLLLPLLLATAAPVAAESTAEFDDAVARLQFAYFTGDTRSLEEVLTLLAEFEVGAGLAAAKSYQLAYGNWKLAQLHGEPPDERPRPNAKSSATKAAKACVQHAREAVAKDPRVADVYAIEAVCDDLASHAISRRTAGCASSKSMRTALTLGAENPRVNFVNALCSPEVEGDPGAVDRWRAVVAKFEAAPPSQPGKPDWGHAEALTLLGESYLQRGDMVAARDVLERALVLAPDYRQAQKLLQTAANRPR